MPPACEPLLVVDADAGTREELARRLTRSGYPVLPAADGPDALAQLNAHPVSVVLLDIRLPGMSGLEVLRRIREEWPADRLPVLVVTDPDESAMTALDLGANDFIMRPIEFPVALARVRAQLSRREAEDRCRASEERYALAARGAHDGLWDWDLVTNEIQYASRWKAIIGCADDDVGATSEEWFGRVHPEDLARLHRDLEAHLAGQTPIFECEHRMRHKSGAFRWVLTRGLATRAADGRPRRIAGSQADVTDGKVVDALTGLPNRMLLMDRLEQALHRQRTHPGIEFALLFLDLDGFKGVNDSLGHQSGDVLLQAVARRLEQSLRATDIVTRSRDDGHGAPAEHTIARLGGDEFVVLLPDVRGVVDATRVADRIQRELQRPFGCGERDVVTTVSIGIAVSATGYARPDEVLRDADLAMYRAKALGKGRCEVFDFVMREQVQERATLDVALRHALERHEFLPHYQAIVDLRTGALHGFEALMRWRHPRRGLVQPNEFVQVIEDNGLVLPIGRQFFRDVCAQLQMWNWNASRPASARLTVNVNFAGHQFVEAGLAETLLEILADAGLDPGEVLIEITEATALANLTRASTVVSQLRDAGLHVVIDDFGSGVSSLACLVELPIAGVKLDPAFIAGGSRHPASLGAVIELTNRLRLTTTAEGVETMQQCEMLRRFGCTYAQGFLFARPLDAESAGALSREERSWIRGAGQERGAESTASR